MLKNLWIYDPSETSRRIKPYSKFLSRLECPGKNYLAVSAPGGGDNNSDAVRCVSVKFLVSLLEYQNRTAVSAIEYKLVLSFKPFQATNAAADHHAQSHY
ncbi:MAG: hypothetical protein ACK58L_07570 [Planctomycetota bacterium]